MGRLGEPRVPIEHLIPFLSVFLLLAVKLAALLLLESALNLALLLAAVDGFLQSSFVVFERVQHLLVLLPLRAHVSLRALCWRLLLLLDLELLLLVLEHGHVLRCRIGNHVNFVVEVVLPLLSLGHLLALVLAFALLALSLGGSRGLLLGRCRTSLLLWRVSSCGGSLSGGWSLLCCCRLAFSVCSVSILLLVLLVSSHFNS